MTNKNDELAGIVSEPAGSAPEVKPAKSLWPRPYENVRIEPTLDPPKIEEVRAPEVSVPQGDFETVPGDSHAEPAIFAPREPEPEPLFEDMPEPKVDEPAAEEPVQEEIPFEEPAAEAPPKEEPASAEAETAEDEPRLESAPEPEAESEPEPEPVVAPSVASEPLRVSEEERAAAVFDRAADQTPPLQDTPAESRGARFVAMAAGIIVALGLGAVAFVYGASALGFKFGGDDTAEAPAAVEATVADAGAGEAPDSQDTASVPAAVEADGQDSGAAAQDEASAEEQLRAAQDRIAELEAQVARLEDEAQQDQPGSNEPAASQPAESEAEPAPTPARDASSAPASEATPAASANNTAPAEPAQAEPTPSESASAQASEPAPPTPPAVPAPRPDTADTAPTRPAETARAEPEVLAPPRSYETRPSYDAPVGGSPEMPVLQNWAVRDVYNGIAVIQGHRGPLMEVEPGDELPGGNRVLAIRRLGGGWAVVTERGIIPAR